MIVDSRFYRVIFIEIGSTGAELAWLFWCGSFGCRGIGEILEAHFFDFGYRVGSLQSCEQGGLMEAGQFGQGSGSFHPELECSLEEFARADERQHGFACGGFDGGFHSIFQG